MKPQSWYLVAGLVASMALAAWAAVAARAWAVEQLSTPEARTAWSAWKRDVEVQQPTAVVQRRVPKSDEPPWLILMRDHFSVMLVTFMVAAALAYGFALLAVHVVRGSRRPLVSGV